MQREFDSERLRNCLEITEKAALLGLHDQTLWITKFNCGTGGCLAGNYALSQGCVPVWDDGAFDGSSVGDDTNAIMTLDGQTRAVADWATEELGLTAVEAKALFAGTNTLSELRRIVGWIIDKREMRSSASP